MKEKLTPNTCNGNCSRCGSCCGIGIPITRKEEKTIREYIKQNNIQKENLFNEVTNTFYCSCCFYDRKNKLCKIYPVRPSICKSFKCNRNPEQLEKEKVINHKRSYWNHMGDDGQIKHITTFDLLFYDDPVPLIRLITHKFNGKITKKDWKAICEFLIEQGHKELVKSMTGIFDED